MDTIKTNVKVIDRVKCIRSMIKMFRYKVSLIKVFWYKVAVGRKTPINLKKEIIKL